MERLYHRYDVDEETPVQFAGVYVTRWCPEWGEPTVLFREVEDDEFATLVRECPEVQALVEAAKEARSWLEIHARANCSCDRCIAEKALRDALDPFEVSNA